jgi:hypothetical protein
VGWLGRLAKKVAQFILCEMRFGHFLLDEIGEDFDYMARERRPTVAPAPDCHFGDAKEPCRGAIAAENYLEQ